MSTRITIKKDANKRIYNVYITGGKKSTLVGKYKRDDILEKMENEDIKGAGYVGKFYEYDIRGRILDDINEKIEEAKNKTGNKDLYSLIPIIKKRMNEIAL